LIFCPEPWPRHLIRHTHSFAMKLRLLLLTLPLASAAPAQTWEITSPAAPITSGSSSYNYVNLWSTLTQSGGTFSANSMDVGSVGAEGRFTLDGGTASFGTLTLAPYRYSTSTTAYGTLLVNGGILNVNSLVLGNASFSNLQPRVFQPGGVVNAGTVTIGYGNGNNAAYYIGGTGTLATGGIQGTGNSGAVRLLHMSGGTIRATAHNDNFIHSTISTQVAGDGVTLDTNGFNIGFHGTFVRDTDDPLIGVITKAGTGTLTLYGANTFSGGFNLQAGTLSVYGDASLGSTNAPIQFTGGMLRVNGTGLASLGAHALNASTFAGGFDIVEGSHTFTVGDALSGTGTFTKAGAGTVVLSGANTLAGGTVSAGTLRITGSFSGNLTNNAALVFDRSTALTYAGVISGTGTLTKDGANTLTLTGLNTHTGGTTVNSGTLELAGPSGTGTGVIRGAVTVGSGATLLASSSNALGFNNERVTSITLNGGTLNHTAAGDQGWGIAYTLNGGTMSSNGGVSSTTTASKFAFGNNTSVTVAANTTNTIAGRVDLRSDGGVTDVAFDVGTDASLNITAAITSSLGTSPGTVGLTKTGAGTLKLTAANTYAGGTTVNGGTLELADPTANGTIRGALVVNSGATVHTSTANALGWIDNQRVTSLTLNGGTLNHTAAGDQGWGVAYTLNGGTMSSNGGTSSSTAASKFAFGNNTSVTVAANTANTIAGRVDLRADGGVTAVAFNVGADASLDITAAVTSSLGAGPGTVGLTKTGTGTLTLTGLNTYTGATTVSAGSLIVNGSLANTAVTVASGATLGGSGSISRLTTLASGARLAAGNSPGTLTFTDGLALNNGSILDFELGATSDLIVVSSGTLSGPSSGTVTLNLTDSGGFTAGVYTLIDATGATLSSIGATSFDLGTTIAGYTYTFAQDGDLFQLIATSAVPEPATSAALLGLLVLSLATTRRHRSKVTQ
jgi:autotransporter-associated beta strand protein